MADAPDLGSGSERIGGSSPLARTIFHFFEDTNEIYSTSPLSDIRHVMNTLTLGEKLGGKPFASMILQKAKDLGLPDASALELLAVARGCWHYRQPEMPDPPMVDESRFTNEELAIALLSPNLPYSPHTIRLGAAMLGAPSNRAEALLNLSKTEGCEVVVRHIAKAGLSLEPNKP